MLLDIWGRDFVRRVGGLARVAEADTNLKIFDQTILVLISVARVTSLTCRAEVPPLMVNLLYSILLYIIIEYYYFENMGPYMSYIAIIVNYQL